MVFIVCLWTENGSFLNDEISQVIRAWFSALKQANYEQLQKKLCVLVSGLLGQNFHNSLLNINKFVKGL